MAGRLHRQAADVHPLFQGHQLEMGKDTDPDVAEDTLTGGTIEH